MDDCGRNIRIFFFHHYDSVKTVAQLPTLPVVSAQPVVPA